MTKNTITLIILLSVFGYAPTSLADSAQSFDWEKSRYTDDKDLENKIKEVTKYFKTKNEDFSDEVKSYIQKTISQYIAQSVSKNKQDAKSILKAFKQKMLSFSLNNQKYPKKIYALINAIKKYKNNFIRKDYLKDDHCPQYTDDVSRINCVIAQYKEFFKSKYHGSESLIKIPMIKRLGKKTLSSVIDQEGLEKTILIMNAFVTQYFIKNNPEINSDIFYIKSNRDILTKMLSDALTFVPNPDDTSTNTIIQQEEITNKQKENSSESQKIEDPSADNLSWIDINKFNIKDLIEKTEELTKEEKIYLKKYFTPVSLFNYLFHDQNPEYTEKWIKTKLKHPDKGLIDRFKALLTGKPWIKDLITRTILDLYEMNKHKTDDNIITKKDLKTIKDASLSDGNKETTNFLKHLSVIFSKLFSEIADINTKHNLKDLKDFENKLYTEAQTYRADLEKLIQEKKKENTGISPEEIKNLNRQFIDSKTDSFISGYCKKESDYCYIIVDQFKNLPSYIPVFIKTYLENILNTDDESLDFIKTYLENILNTDDEVLENQEVTLNESNTNEEQLSNSEEQEPENDPAAEPLARNPDWNGFHMIEKVFLQDIGLTDKEKNYFQTLLPQLGLFYSILHDEKFDYQKSWIKTALDSNKEISENAKKEILPLLMRFKKEFFAPNPWIKNLIERIMYALDKNAMNTLKEYKAGISNKEHDQQIHRDLHDVWLKFTSLLFAIKNFNKDHKLDIEKELSVYVKDYKKYREEYRKYLEKETENNPNKKPEDIEHKFIDEKIQPFIEKRIKPYYVKEYLDKLRDWKIEWHEQNGDPYSTIDDLEDDIPIFVRAYWENILHMDEKFLEKNKISLLTPDPAKDPELGLY